MKELNVVKFTKIWFKSIVIFDVLLIVYMLFTGRVLDNGEFPDFLAFINALLALISAVVAITSGIYFIAKKDFPNIVYSIGVLFFASVLFILSLVLAIASINF